jgi:hypothetical protein
MDLVDDRQLKMVAPTASISGIDGLSSQTRCPGNDQYNNKNQFLSHKSGKGAFAPPGAAKVGNFITGLY